MGSETCLDTRLADIYEQSGTINMSAYTHRCTYSEALCLDERRFSFVSELKKLVAASIHKSAADIKSFDKLAEGAFNRIFAATVSDGTSILARLPYPSTQPKQLAIASEVATIDCLRPYGLPAPKIFEYVADSVKLIGAEYIYILSWKKSLGNLSEMHVTPWLNKRDLNLPFILSKWRRSS